MPCNESAQNKILELLRQFGGFEIAQITGAMLAAAEQKITLLIDGFIVTAASLAVKIVPSVVTHGSSVMPESGHGIMLETLKARPLLDLGATPG